MLLLGFPDVGSYRPPFCCPGSERPGRPCRALPPVARTTGGRLYRGRGRGGGGPLRPGVGSDAVMSYWLPLALAGPRSRRFRFRFSLDRARCFYWSPLAAAVSFVPNVIPRLVSVFAHRAWPWFWSCAAVSPTPPTHYEFLFDTKLPPPRSFGAGRIGGGFISPPDEPFRRPGRGSTKR